VRKACDTLRYLLPLATRTNVGMFGNGRFFQGLLSYLYTLLTYDVASALEVVGLDPYVGFLHRDRPGRPSLALDLMEELRPVFADRLALSLVNRKQIQGKGFTQKESGGVLMDDETRKKVITAWQERKKEEITHPYLKERIPFGLIPHVQAMLLARYLRGDLDAGNLRHRLVPGTLESLFHRYDADLFSFLVDQADR